MKRSLILAFAILMAGAVLVTWLWRHGPRPEPGELPARETAVDVMVAARSEVAIVLRSQGVVEAKTRTQVASEVSGKVIEVLPPFEAGAWFEADDVLLRLDPSDYENAVAQAKSALAQAEMQLQLEEARASQAQREWERLGRAEGASPLTLREPQLASARAAWEAAKAQVAKAERDLARTVVRAPYDGRMLRTHTDLGSYAPLGSPLAEFYQADELEVRLPVPLDDLEFLELGGPPIPVVLTAPVGGPWRGSVVRKEGEIDRQSRSLHLVASIEVPPRDHAVVMVPGLFVRAEIEGKVFPEVVRLPSRALHDGEYVIVVDEENRLRKRLVELWRREKDEVVLRSGVEEGERVCVSYLASFVEGMTVSVAAGRGVAR